MRLISFALTCDQVLAQTKTQTRRLGWDGCLGGTGARVQVGDRLRGVRKVQGRRKGEPLVDVAIVEITAIRRERLDGITSEDLAREGFPELTPAGFCQLFPCEPSDEVTVIDFRYLDRSLVDFMIKADRGGSWADRMGHAARFLDKQNPRTARGGLTKPKPGTLDAVRHLLIRHGIEVPRG